MNHGIRNVLFWWGVAQLMLYNYHKNIIVMNRRWQWRPKPTFDGLDRYWCWNFLRFRKEHLWRISEALLLPAELQLDNGMWTDNQEMLIITLLRLATTDAWLKLECMIQVEYSRMSRVFSATIAHITLLWSFKLTDNWDYFIPKLARYKQIMRQKLREVNNNQLPHRYRNCFGSIDGKRFEIARPSGANNQQYYAYNDYYGFHQLGFQSVVVPDGLIMHFSGPHAGCGNDLNLLADSSLLRDLHNALRAANMDNVALDIVADKIYNILARGIASLRQNPTNAEQVEDTAGSKIRVPVEWNFGKITLHFPFINIYFHLKLNEREIGSYMNVSALLTNVHTCLYGSQCSKYFSQDFDIVHAPSLEDYMQF